MKKILLILIVILLGIAYLTKPDNKTCIIEGVKAVWGTMVPDVNKTPDFFEQYMNVASRDVEVKDWVFFRVVNYSIKQEKRAVALGAFKNVFALVRPYEQNPYIPRMPKQ